MSDVTNLKVDVENGRTIMRTTSTTQDTPTTSPIPAIAQSFSRTSITQDTPPTSPIPAIAQSFSMDSAFDENITRMSMKLTSTRNKRGSVMASLESVLYDAATIREEFKSYRHVLPHPDKLLQEQHSVETLIALLEKHNLEPPRFLNHECDEYFVKPHHALCCLLLDEYNADLVPEGFGSQQQGAAKQQHTSCYTKLVQALSFGAWYPQLNHPAAFIRDQFYRAAPAIPRDVVKPEKLRKSIRNAGLPIPNYFFDPEEPKQFPPHIALLVILQDGEEESRKLDSVCIQIFFSIIAFVALLLRIVLEVIGGAGAIWGGAEVFGLRAGHNGELWRWISVGVGILCLIRFVTLNAPQAEDEGDILGPAGPWSLRFPSRLRAIGDHPFHYFFRGLPPAKMQSGQIISHQQY